MATKFNVWVEQPSATSANPNVVTEAAFNEDTSRIEGWKAGDAISSIKMNTILRQNSLIAAALVEAFLSNTTIGILSSIEDVKTAMLASIAMKADVTSLGASITTLSDSVKSISTSMTNVEKSIRNMTSGASPAGNASKLGGQDASYYQKSILSGIDEPSGGVNGDIYIRYSER